MKLKEKPGAMIGPTLFGIGGLFTAITASGGLRVLGLVIFLGAIVFWVVFGFIVTPKPPKTLALIVVALLATSMLTGCDPDPNPRLVNGVTIVDNPAAMNGDNLAILRYWWVATHNPAIVTGADSEMVQTIDEKGTVSSTEGLIPAVVTPDMPANVIWARQAWLDTMDEGGQCIFSVTLTGIGVIAAAANPPVGIGATIVAWGLGLGGVVSDIWTCWNMFHWSVQEDGEFRWLHYCNNAYHTTNEWNMLNPAWQPSDDIKWEYCVVKGWGALLAASLGVPVDSNGNAILGGHRECDWYLFVELCHWV